MKILLTSDWHVDAVTAGFRRAPDLERAVQKTVEVAKELAVDWWGFLGDLSDPDSGAATIRAIELSLAVAEALSPGRASIRNFWIAGNHDVVEDGSGRTTLSPLRAAGIQGTHVFEDPGTLTLGGTTRLVALPFVARARAYDPDEWVRQMVDDLEGSELNIVVEHLQVEGAKLGSETTDMPRGRDVAFPFEAVKCFPRRLCLGGHYHQRQRVGELQIVGSLERLTFGEQGNAPGFLVVEV